MANKKFSSAVTQRFDINFATTPVVKNSTLSVGTLPDNCLITDGWVVIKTELGDADNADDTTLSIGYTGAATAFYPATSIAGMDAGVYLKLIPGVINIGSNELIATVDTPAEIVGIARVSADTHSGKVLTDNKALLFTASNDQNINAGTISVFLTYLKF
jgi:hypothetical protein